MFLDAGSSLAWNTEALRALGERNEVWLDVIEIS